MSARRPVRVARAGLTLVELVVAVGLLALLMASVFGVLRSFLDVWDKSELRRARVEEASAIGELFASDLVQADPGKRGDFLAEWVPFDTDGDGARDAWWPRLRWVRHASPAEIARLQARSAEPELGQGLLEVAWAVVPAYKGKDAGDRRSEGLLLRGERIVLASDRPSTPDGRSESYFDPRFFGRGGEPPAGALNEVSGGLLWFGMQFATQTTRLEEGWQVGARIQDATTSWDAWSKARPDAKLHVWNEAGAGMPKAKSRALLPRRVLLELEFEREREALRRTRLAELLTLEATTMVVEDPTRLPTSPGAFVKLDGEWLRLGVVTGRNVAVQRAMRGTTAANHDRGARVHFGETYRKDVPIRLAQEDWGL